MQMQLRRDLLQAIFYLKLLLSNPSRRELPAAQPCRHGRSSLLGSMSVHQVSTAHGAKQGVRTRVTEGGIQV